MEFYSITRKMLIADPRQQLLENRTIQWFLYGNPNYMDEAIKRLAKEMNKEIEQRITNFFMYGTSHPEIYNQE